MMSSLFLRLCKALRSEGLRLSCLGNGGLCLAMSDSTLLMNVSRSRPA